MSDPLYSADQIERIGADIWDVLGYRIEAHAREYLEAVAARLKRPPVKKVREKLRQLVGRADRFAESASSFHDDLDMQIQVGPGLWSRVQKLREEVRSLIPELEKAVDGYGRWLDPSDWPRIRFVGRLAEVWEDVHGGSPTRRVSYHSGKEYGPFGRFAEACLEPIDPDALRGIDHIVRRVVEIMADSG